MSRIRLPKISFWQVILMLIMIAGLYATILRFTKGLSATTNLNDRFPWGIWIGFDVMSGVALAAGGFTISAIVYIFHIEKYHPIIRPTILTAFLGYTLVVVGLMFDLGRPYNIWHPLIMWNPHSVMFEVGWCVTLYTTVLALEFSPMVFERFRWQKLYKVVKSITVPLVIVGVLLSTLHQSSLGTLYLIVPNKLHALWYTPLLPLFFYISAIALGCAMTIFESYLSQRAFRKSMEFHLLNKLGAVAAIALLVYLAMKVFDMHGRGVLGLAFQSTYEGRMFLAEMLIGVIAPIVMLLLPRIRNNQTGLFIASLMVILGVVMNRINVSITGMDRASGVNYFPSWTELAVTASIVALGFVLFGLAVKYLEVFPAEEMNEIAVGKLAELPATAAFRQPLRSATTFAFVLGFVFMFGAVALSYDGIRLRPAPASIDEGIQNSEFIPADLNVPERIPIKMGPNSPGLVVFNHKQHINTEKQMCVGCHAGKFKLLESSVDITPMKKMNYCGECHDGVTAVGIRDTAKCTSCHERK